MRYTILCNNRLSVLLLLSMFSVLTTCYYLYIFTTSNPSTRHARKTRNSLSNQSNLQSNFQSNIEYSKHYSIYKSTIPAAQRHSSKQKSSFGSPFNADTFDIRTVRSNKHYLIVYWSKVRENVVHVQTDKE